MRVATGALSHETSTFTPVPTTRESYEARQGFLRGDEILTHFFAAPIRPSAALSQGRTHMASS